MGFGVVKRMYLIISIIVFMAAVLSILFYIILLESNLIMKIFESTMCIISLPGGFIYLWGVFKNEFS